MPNFSVNASASSADSGAVPDVTARMLARSSRRQVGVQHHAQRGGHQRHRAGPVPAHGVGPLVELEPLQQRERPASATHCSTRNTPPMCTSGALTIATPLRSSVGVGDRSGSRPDHAARQHVVGEVDALGRTGGAAGQHPHRDAGAAGVVAACRRGATGVRRPESEIDTNVGAGDGATSVRQVVGVADDHRQFAAPRCRPGCGRRRGTG